MPSPRSCARQRTRTAQAVEAARAALERKAKETTAALPEAEPLRRDQATPSLANRALGVSATAEGQHVLSKGVGRAAARADVDANQGQHIGPARSSAPTKPWPSWRRFSTARRWRRRYRVRHPRPTAPARFARSCASTWRPRPMWNVSRPVRTGRRRRRVSVVVSGEGSRDCTPSTTTDRPPCWWSRMVSICTRA